MNIEDPTHWEQLLSKLLQPDSAVIKEATELIHKLIQQPQSVLSLFGQLEGSFSQNPSIRQLAGVLIRRAIIYHWSTFNNEIQQTFKNRLLEIIANKATPRVVRRAAVHVAIRIAAVTLAQGQWPEFMPVILQMITSPEVEHRELCLYVFQTLLEAEATREDVCLQNLQSTQQVILAGLQDPSIDVKVRAMACAWAFTECFHQGSDPKLLFELLEPLVHSIRACLEDSDERVAPGFEFIEYLAEAFIEEIKPLLPNLLGFVLDIGATLDLDISIRQKALLLVEAIVSYKSKTFLKCGLFNRTLDVTFVLMTEQDDDQAGEDTGSKYGSNLLNAMALKIPPEYIFQPVMQKVVEYVKNSNAEARKAGITAITVISEGCADNIDENFSEIIPIVLSAFQDPEDVVRQAACICVAEFARNIPGSVVEYAEQLVPILLAGLSDPHDLVRVKSCYAISECGASMSEHFVPHMERMLQRLVELLSDRNTEVQELAVSALSSLVEMAEERFAPFFEPVMVMMKRWMNITDRDKLMVRARATECVGSLASAIKAEIFIPHIPEVMTIALSGLPLQHDELREFIFGFFEHFVTVFAPEWTAPYVDTIMPYLLSTAKSSEGIEANEEDEFNLNLEEDKVGEEFDYHAVANAMSEKSAALSCLGKIAEVHSQQFAKYLEETAEILLELIGFEMAPHVSSSALDSLVNLCTSVKNLTQPDLTFERGVVKPLATELEQIVVATMEGALSTFLIPDDVIVRGALDSIGKLGTTIGPVIYTQYLENVEKFIITLLNRKAPCQNVAETFDEGSEDDFAIFAAALELVSQMAKSMGEHLVPSLVKILPHFEPHLKPDAPFEYTNCAVATVAEILQELKEAFQPFCQALLPVTISSMQLGKENYVIHNASYCSSLLIQYGGASVNEYYLHLVNALSPLFAVNHKKYPTVADNACGCLARMIKTNPSLVPLEQVLPVLLNSLPLRNDFEPAIPTYECIFDLLKNNNPVILTLIPQVISLFAREIVQGGVNLGDPVREQMVGFLKQMVPVCGPLMNEVFTGLGAQGIISIADLQQLQSYLV